MAYLNQLLFILLLLPDDGHFVLVLTLELLDLVLLVLDVHAKVILLKVIFAVITNLDSLPESL